MYKRIDRFIERALKNFGDWLGENQWQGKERDCINLFVMQFLLSDIGPDNAISDRRQIRIEGGVPQPEGYQRLSATKDLVIWKNPAAVAWNDDWQPINKPWVVMEWKTRRHGKFKTLFDDHDSKWLTAFTREYTQQFGYAVTVDFCKGARALHWCRYRRGQVARVSSCEI